jgi:hypothetical protein
MYEDVASDSESYDDDETINYGHVKEQGETVNGTVQQSMKHFQPTSKTLSK